MLTMTNIMIFFEFNFTYKLMKHDGEIFVVYILQMEHTVTENLVPN